MKLIDKEKVVEEIERIKKEECPTDSYEGRCKMLWFEQFSSFLDTLETKEVDLEVEDAFIDKACEWLKFNYTEYLNDTRVGFDIDEMVKDFKMNMKGK